MFAPPCQTAVAPFSKEKNTSVRVLRLISLKKQVRWRKQGVVFTYMDRETLWI